MWDYGEAFSGLPSHGRGQRMTTLELHVANVGGIDKASFSFESPVSIVTGPNATNKTSLHQALAFALGQNELSIRSDATEAEVTLSIDGESVTRTARRAGQGIQIDGDAWVPTADGKELFKYFGCLLEFNPLRSAVRQNEDLEAVLKEPVNIDALEQQQSAKMNEKRSLQRGVEQLEDVENQIREQEQTIETQQERKAELEAELERLQEKQTETSHSNGELETLREQRTDLVLQLKDLEQQIDDLEGAISRLESEREEVLADLEEKQEDTDQYDVNELKAQRQSLREDIEEITQRQELLQSVLTSNREMLNSQYTGVLGQDSDLMGKTVNCWVCGDSAPVEDIEENFAELQEVIERDKQKKRGYEPQIETIEDEISEAKAARQRLKELETRRSNIDQKLENRTGSLETKREKAESVREERNELDERIADLESEQTTEITDLTDEIESVMVDLQSTDQAIERAERQIETLEAQRRERKEKEDRIDELSEEISTLTDRIESLEHHLREEFNEAMDDLVTELNFQRIERIWLDGTFDLVIARDIEGSVREDTPGSLSESEREVVGLVLALAGYTAYELEEVTPVLQLDTLGALDAHRVSRLVEYFSDTPEFLIATVLPENAEQIEYASIKPVEQTQFSETPS